MKKIGILLLTALFATAGWGLLAQNRQLSPVKKNTTTQLSPRVEHRQAREARRTQRQAEYEQYLDSIIAAGSFQFKPRTMQRMPSGMLHLITNPEFSVQYWNGAMDIFLPYVAGMMAPYTLTVINYSLPNVEEYLTHETDDGWKVVFVTSLYSGSSYTFTLDVYTKTGSATMTIQNPWNNTIQYTGSIMAS